MTPTTSFLILLSIILLSACINKANERTNQEINYKDTLYQTRIYSITDGDTVWQYDTIYNSPTDLTVPVSNFYYESFDQPGKTYDLHRIYFNREKVVAFCDSMLLALTHGQKIDPSNNEQWLYDHIRIQAANNKMDEAILVDELPALMQRFRPLLINQIKPDTPKYLIINQESINGDHERIYSFKSKAGDTVFLSGGMMGDVHLKDIN